jgi:hypothetical protein
MRPTRAQMMAALDAALAAHIAEIFKNDATSMSVAPTDPKRIANGLSRAIAVYETFAAVIAAQPD